MPNPIPQRRTETGFTLIELVVAIAILAIILGLAVPSMQSYILNQRVRNATFDLTSDLLYTRGEATKRNADVLIAATGGSWQNGWTISAGGVTLKERQIIRDLAVAATGATITFRHNGRLAGNAQQRFDLTTSATTTGVTPRCLIVNTSGKVSSEC